jgi:NAD(P) transhydrogenase subunit alpha
MKIAIAKERRPYESRVAATPETVKKYIEAGHQVIIEKGAGEGSSLSDQAYEAVGAQIVSSFQEAVKGAQVVLKVQRPMTAAEGTDEISALDKGSILIGLLSPYTSKDMLKLYAERQITAISMEMLPRITRAQSMDVLSSQTNLAGYRAVVEASHVFDRAFPMMMTAAGTIAPARVLILGAGVAGLQAIATARRLGAVVSAFDVREAAKEQVESLGATFITVPAATSGDDGKGYAKEMDEDYQKRQAERIQEALKTNDIVITTAQIPGKQAPLLIKESMLDVMKPGSVIMDLAVESGGNCEVSKLGEIVDYKGIKVVGYANLASRIARDASSLYARNLLNFMNLLISKDTKQPNFDFEDQIIKGVTLSFDGKIVHETFQN